MKRSFILISIIPQLLYAQYQSKEFMLPNDRNATFQAVEIKTIKDSVLTLNISQPISGFFVSGITTFENAQDSYTRVTIKDKNNTEYLVYENYPLLSGSNHSRFSKVAVESVLLPDIVPISMKIELLNASIQIDSLFLPVAQNLKQGFLPKAKAILQEQAHNLAEKLNTHIRESRMTWLAGCTSIASKTFEEKKKMFGSKVPCFYGFEYYKGGLYIINPMPEDIRVVAQPSLRDNTFVRDFDWRNRHGKNWISSIKNQQDRTCWAHATTATLESNLNIYFNQHFPDDEHNNDLSEQELISCITSDGNTIDHRVDIGGSTWHALNYVKQNGIVREECFPYMGKVTCDYKCATPSEQVSFYSFKNYYYSNLPSSYNYLDSLKKAIIKSPVVVDYFNKWGHSVSCVGFHQIQMGDTLCDDISGWDVDSFYVVNNNNSYLVNRTSWIIKNSWGSDWGENGFAKVSFDNVSLSIRELSGPYTSLIYSDNDICVTDDDGDGYFTWGSGPKPSHCPAWAPDNHDGDDSNSLLGQINEYGFCDTLSVNRPMYEYIKKDSTLTITENRSNYLGILRGACVVVQAQQTFASGRKLLLDNGATLIVDGTVINGSCIQSYSGSKIILNNNGRITKPFEVPVGVELIILKGKIE